MSRMISPIHMRPVRRNTLWMFPQVGVVVDLIVFVDLVEGSSQRSHLPLRQMNADTQTAD